MSGDDNNDTTFSSWKMSFLTHKTIWFVSPLGLVGFKLKCNWREEINVVIKLKMGQIGQGSWWTYSYSFDQLLGMVCWNKGRRDNI